MRKLEEKMKSGGLSVKVGMDGVLPVVLYCVSTVSMTYLRLCSLV